MARKRKSHWPWFLLLLIIVAGALFFLLHRGAWSHVWADLFGRRPQATAVASTALSPCGAPLPKLAGGALAASRAAKFATLEQLEKSQQAQGGVFRVQAHLLGLARQGAQIQLQLGSLVNPKLTMEALIPAAACGGSQEDQALYDELREVVTLRFGPLQARLQAPAQPTEVVATGAVVRGPHGLELRPLLDLHVQ